MLDIKRGHTFLFEAYDPEGNLKWKEQIHNLVVDEGLDELLDRSYNGATVNDSIGLTGSTPTFASSDTMGSHAGWTEVTAYSETNRPVLNMGTPSGQSVDNSGNVAVFSINSDNTTIGGGFISSDNTKGGTTGILIGGAAFNSADKVLDNGDTLNVTITATASSS